MKPSHKQATAAEVFGRDEALDLQILDEMDRERVKREARRRLNAEERGRVTIPEIATLQQRLSRQRESVQWRIRDWQPGNSRVILTAQFKAGKTTIVGNLIRSLADADLWLGRDEVQYVVGAIGLIDTEMSCSQLDGWLGDQGIERAEHVVVIPLRGHVASFDLLDRDVRAHWAAQLREYRVEYLILDCLRPVLDALGLDEHRDAGRFLVALDALLQEAGIADCLVVHHMGHMGERARGDSRLRDWPDVEWRLVRQDDQPHSPRFITGYGRDVNIPESLLEYDAGTRHLTIAQGSRQDGRARAALTAVTEVLSASPDALSLRAIQKALAESDYPRAQVRAAIQWGVREGVIKTEPGPKRAILHRLTQCAEVRRECAGAQASVCASAYIARHTHTLTDPVDGDVSRGTLPDTDAALGPPRNPTH
jgi:hypothetical protein